MRILLPCLSGILATAIYTGCSEIGDGPPSMDPVGDGLTFIGVCVVVAMLVLVIGISRK